ncbi:hypothetical protein Emed_005474 [Eimeria media]
MGGTTFFSRPSSACCPLSLLPVSLKVSTRSPPLPAAAAAAWPAAAARRAVPSRVPPTAGAAAAATATATAATAAAATATAAGATTLASACSVGVNLLLFSQRRHLHFANNAEFRAFLKGPRQALAVGAVAAVAAPVAVAAAVAAAAVATVAALALARVASNAPPPHQTGLCCSLPVLPHLLLQGRLVRGVPTLDYKSLGVNRQRRQWPFFKHRQYFCPQPIPVSRVALLQQQPLSPCNYRNNKLKQPAAVAAAPPAAAATAAAAAAGVRITRAATDAQDALERHLKYYLSHSSRSGVGEQLLLLYTADAAAAKLQLQRQLQQQMPYADISVSCAEGSRSISVLCGNQNQELIKLHVPVLLAWSRSAELLMQESLMLPRPLQPSSRAWAARSLRGGSSRRRASSRNSSRDSSVRELLQLWLL